MLLTLAQGVFGDTVAHYALALDVGGTFTDVMLMHRESGQLWTVKTPRRRPILQRGFFRGSRKYCSWQR
jgi:N-methylhydantoinase A/oxoprolinase/acetone carboxylase beta subunit